MFCVIGAIHDKFQCSGLVVNAMQCMHGAGSGLEMARIDNPLGESGVSGSAVRRHPSIDHTPGGGGVSPGSSARAKRRCECSVRPTMSEPHHITGRKDALPAT